MRGYGERQYDCQGRENIARDCGHSQKPVYPLVLNGVPVEVFNLVVDSVVDVRFYVHKYPPLIVEILRYLNLENHTMDNAPIHSGLYISGQKVGSGNPDWVQMRRNVELFIRRWFGIVSGVRLPSGFSRTIEIWFLPSNTFTNGARQSYA